MKTNEQNNLKTKTLIKKNTDLFLVVLFDSETSEAFDLDAVLSRTSLLRIVHASQSCHLIRFQIIIIRRPFEGKLEKDKNCFVRIVIKRVVSNGIGLKLNSYFKVSLSFFFWTNRTEPNGMDWIGFSVIFFLLHFARTRLNIVVRRVLKFRYVSYACQSVLICLLA